jgi:DNA-binding Lrp family transcriptional regulator
MAKMTIAEAAAHFNVSKEAIHNRIRRGSLDSIIENGMKYVSIEEVQDAQTNHVDQRYYDYIEEENSRLKERIEKLENETSSLRDKREATLIAEREKIEQIYKERDEQLRSVLHVVASKFLTAQNMNQVIDDAVNDSETSQDAEVISEAPIVTAGSEHDLISLKRFLKLKQYSKKKREKLKKRFAKKAKMDERIILVEEKIYLRPNTFDYSDLL